ESPQIQGHRRPTCPRADRASERPRLIATVARHIDHVRDDLDLVAVTRQDPRPIDVRLRRYVDDLGPIEDRTRDRPMRGAQEPLADHVTVPADDDARVGAQERADEHGQGPEGERLLKMPDLVAARREPEVAGRDGNLLDDPERGQLEDLDAVFDAST